LVDGPSLLGAAAATNPVPWLALVVVVAVGLWRSPRRLMRTWAAIDRGLVLRWLAGPLVVLLAWEGAFHPYNFLLDHTFPLDRLLILALAAGALWRPLLLIPLALMSRVIAGQFALPSGILAAQNIDELLIIVLLAVAGAHLITAMFGRDDTAPLVLVIMAAVATHFFVPGRGKLVLEWLTNENLANLATSGYNVGWLGQTDGSLARFLVAAVTAVGWPIRAAALGLELASGVVVIHYRAFLWWLPVAMSFHVLNFLFLGYWFLGWVVLEIGLVVLLTRPGLSEWLGRNLSPGRAVMSAAAVVIAGPWLFHPPALAWLDSPVSYGWELEGVGRSGQAYHVPIRALAPFEQEITFGRLGLGATRPLTGPYGVVESAASLHDLAGLTDPAGAMAHEQLALSSDLAAAEKSEAFLVDFLGWTELRSTGGGLPARVAALAPPPKFWTGRAQPNYRFQEPLSRLEIRRVIGVREGDVLERRQVRVLILSVDGDGMITADHVHEELP